MVEDSEEGLGRSLIQELLRSMELLEVTLLCIGETFYKTK